MALTNVRISAAEDCDYLVPDAIDNSTGKSPQKSATCPVNLPEDGYEIFNGLARSEIATPNTSSAIGRGAIVCPGCKMEIEIKPKENLEEYAYAYSSLDSFTGCASGQNLDILDEASYSFTDGLNDTDLEGSTPNQDSHKFACDSGTGDGELEYAKIKEHEYMSIPFAEFHSDITMKRNSYLSLFADDQDFLADSEQGNLDRAEEKLKCPEHYSDIVEIEVESTDMTKCNSPLHHTYAGEGEFFPQEPESSVGP